MNDVARLFVRELGKRRVWLTLVVADVLPAGSEQSFLVFGLDGVSAWTIDCLHAAIVKVARHGYVAETLQAPGAQIGVCGGVRAEVAGVDVASQLGLRGQTLLAYLVLERERPVSRDELALALWPDRDAHASGNALRTQLSRLRAALPERTLRGRTTLQLELPDPVWVDVEAAEAAAREAETRAADRDWQGALPLAERAAATLRQPLLGTVDLPWVEERRRVLDSLEERALALVAQAGLQLGGASLAAAETAARRFVERQPFSERAHRLLMDALQAQGEVAEALRVYDELRVRLREELGAAPEPGLVALHGQLLAGVAPPGRTAEAAEISELPTDLAAPEQLQLAGRRLELLLLERVLDEATPGRPKVVVLDGDAGVGKSRLLREAGRAMHEAGAVTMYGAARPEAVAAYEPIIDALRDWLRRGDRREVLDLLGWSARELARLLPELGPGSGHDGGPSTGADERTRLFEAVAFAFSRIAGGRKLAIVLDDLQWVDRPTALLLRRLCAGDAASSLIIIAARRVGEQATEEVDGLVARLQRDGRADVVRVGPLPPDDARELAHAALTARGDAATVDRLLAHAEGNPLFLLELAREAHADALDVHAPAGVGDLAERRIEALPAAVRDALEIAAVLGRDVGPAQLITIVGDRNVALEALEAGVACGLLVEDEVSGPRWRFGHDLMRRGVLNRLSAARRARLHLRCAEALDGPELSGQTLAAVAFHYDQAAELGVAQRAVELLTLAGRAAVSQLAFEDAARHFERATKLLEDVLGAEPAAVLEPLLELGAARMRAGDERLARRPLERAAEIARESGDATALARAALTLGGVWGQVARYDGGLVALLEEADAALPGGAPERIQVRARLAVERYFSRDTGELSRSDADSRLALDLARAARDPALEATALAARHWSLLAHGSAEERHEVATRLTALADRIGELELAFWAVTWRLRAAMELGDLRTHEQDLALQRKLAAELRQPRYMWSAALHRTLRPLLDGDFEEAERRARAAYAIGARVDGPDARYYDITQRALIFRFAGRLGDIADEVGCVAAEFPQSPVWRAILAAAHYEAGEVDAASEQLRDLLAEQAVPSTWLYTLEVMSDLACDLGDAESAAHLFTGLAASRDRVAVLGRSGLCSGPVARPLGGLAACIGRRDEARELFAAARATAEAMAAPVVIAAVDRSAAVLV